jgi:CRISPR/Cas system-associated exonuclease Cas4 (RecB family)
MFQVIAMWNLSKPDEEMKDSVDNIDLRGYNTDSFLTGEFSNKLANEDLRPLSVSNVADKYCFTRRDLYIYKGVNRPDIDTRQETWGSKAGYIIEEYIERFLRNENVCTLEGYKALLAKGHNMHDCFITERENSLEKLRKLEESSHDGKIGDTDWLLSLLSNNGRAELANKILHLLLKENGSLDTAHIKIKEEIKPNKIQIGINSPVTPDFIVPEFGIVGDIKTGVEFKPHFQLTCAGYALAYENEYGKDNNINWGIIYFFPSRKPKAFVRPINFAQLYIFPIDDLLRESFLALRDEAYTIISKSEFPEFPPVNEREHCKYCRFKDYCITQGLELDYNE